MNAFKGMTLDSGSPGIAQSAVPGGSNGTGVKALSSLTMGTSSLEEALARGGPASEAPAVGCPKLPSRRSR
jgi:hypothetical protein